MVSVRSRSDRRASELVPVPAPGGSLDWDGLCEAALQWGYPIEALRVCAQEPLHHGEGDVAAHTRLVCEEMVADSAWAGLDPERRAELLLTGLLHDVAKPECTTVEDGRIRQPGHAHRGENIARVLLWRAGVDWRVRERVAQAIRWHLHPFYLLEREDPTRLVTEIAQSLAPRELAILARADARGRICADMGRLLEAVALFEEFAVEAGCSAAAYPFGSDAARFSYFSRPARERSYVPFEPEGQATMTICVGLPAAGKDTWCAAQDAPVVSLDAIRAETGAKASGKQGPVVALGRERAKAYLRARRDFVWNATSLSRKLRTALVGLGDDYGVRIRLVCFEARPETLAVRNGARAVPVPAGAIARMLAQWETPTTAECHRLEVLETD